MATNRLEQALRGAIATATILLLAACSASGLTGPSAGSGEVVIDWPHPRASGTFSATLGATRWSASHASVFFFRGQGGEPDTFGVIGTDGRFIVSVGATVRGVGTFTTTSSLNADFEVIDALRLGRRWVAGHSHASSLGALTLTSLSPNRATGTFSFTGVGTTTNDALVVSNGVFDLTY